MNTRDMWEAMKELSDKQFKIYMAVHKLADNDVGYCFASDEHIGEKVNKVRKNVNEGVNELIRLGFLNVLKINQGFKVIERRLYTADCYKNFLKDSKLKIVKTTYEKKRDKKGNEYIVYYNEKNLKKSTSNDSVTGTSNDSVTVTSSKNNLSKNNKLESKNPELVSFENFFKENMGINFTATNQKAVDKLLKQLKTEEAVKSFLYDNYKMAVSNKEKDPTVKTVEGLFVHWLKKGERIPEYVPKQTKKEIKENPIQETKKEITEEKIVDKNEELKEITLTAELEEKAIQILIEKEKLTINFINDTKRKSKFRYETMLKQVLREVC